MTEALDTIVHPSKISGDALDQLFREARTHSAWLPKRVPVETLREAYELARMGPTSANSSPARFVFLQSEAAKATPSARPRSPQRRKDKSSSGDRHCRLGHRVL
jgi:Nitroreductase family